MTGATGDALGAQVSVVLAHHSLVLALPAVVPMVALSGAFAAIVVADRRRSRRGRAGHGATPPPAESVDQEPHRAR